ncbi:LIC_10190 family membrane protein [Mangrovimonas spongiae]|uniref:DUF8201 domain-containing protein n=1 Tax=Mangrovimonas spongiae TaxID=2494697 RepID=A0A3R9PI48_9FLAO|nr:hypothetical protein [Mangrovimonas spongiae]RSK38727.1 hypothetical protein EJA19_11770 [Mangrovimonas spongiae]
MLLILLSYCYILVILGIVGIGINHLFRIHNNHPVQTITHGIFGIIVLGLLWAMVAPLSIGIHIVLVIITILLAIKYKQEVITLYQNAFTSFFQLNTIFKVFFLITTILVILKCAGPPTLPDNESYYVQSIKWFTQYGMVTGLINLHPFLGQASGWHVLQSIFGFGFVTNNLNDLNGLILILINLFAFEKLNKYINNQNKNYYDLIIGLWPITNVVGFMLIASPSTDLPVYSLGILIIYLALSYENSPNTNNLKSLWILTATLWLIKATTFWYILIPMMLTFKCKIHTKKVMKFALVLLIITSSILIVKNIIITGNPIYPLTTIKTLKTSWALPTSVEGYLFQYLKSYGYGLTPNTYNTSNSLQHIIHWLTNNGIDSILNLMALTIFLLTPLVYRKLKQKQALSLIYIVAVVQLFTLLITSPQLRFYLGFVLFFTCLLAAKLFKHKKAIITLLVVSIIFTSLSMLPVTKQLPIPNSLKNISWRTIIIPHENTNENQITYKKIKEGNTVFYSPATSDFFWGTHNAPLPALNKQQLDYFKKYFKTIPQQRTNNLKDGFISKKIVP